jgi:hypothetical protein
VVEVETQAKLVGFSPSSFVARGLSTSVPRGEIEKAIEYGEYPTRLMLDIDRLGDDVSHARVAVEWDEAMLRGLLESTSEDEVVLWFDPEELGRAFEEGEVDAHGLREKAAVFAVAVAAAGAGAGGALAHTENVGGAAVAGNAATPAFVSDVANSAAVAQQTANLAAGQSDAISRYQANVAADESAAPVSDVASSDAVARYEANQLAAQPVSDVASSDALARYEANQQAATPVSDVASSDALARYEANLAAGQPVSDLASSDALSRYEANVASNEGDALSRYQANAATDAIPSASVSATGTSWSPSAADDAALAAGLALLITGAGFAVGKSRRQQPKPA